MLACGALYDASDGPKGSGQQTATALVADSAVADVNGPGNVEVARLALEAGTLNLAVDLLSALGQADKLNILFSPYSLSRALGLLYLGAGGRTAKQLAEALQGNFETTQWVKAHAEVQASLAGQGKRYKAHTQLLQADALWGAPGVAPSHDVKQAMVTAFADPWHTVDFATAPWRARETINRWVCEQTGGHIHDLLAQGTPAPSTRLLLTSTLFVSAPWARPFSASNVHMAPFLSADGRLSQVSTLVGHMRAAYGTAQGWVAVDIPYRASGLSLTIMWPQKGSLAAAQASLDGPALAHIWKALQPGTISLSLPKFKVETSHPIKEALMALGVVDVFRPDQANLSGMEAGPVHLYVDALLHRTTLEINERGTQASAATGIVLRPTSIAEPTQTVTVDRPFLFFMRDSAAMTLLFAGRIATLGAP